LFGSRAVLTGRDWLHGCGTADGRVVFVHADAEVVCVLVIGGPVVPGCRVQQS
jgi:hypothetical protein